MIREMASGLVWPPLQNSLFPATQSRMPANSIYPRYPLARLASPLHFSVGLGFTQNSSAGYCWLESRTYPIELAWCV
jgi:hypothetical protein